MSILKTSIVSLIATLCVVSGASALGHGTPDGVTPAVEDICSGLQGAAYGLCNAYCEAQDCDAHPKKSCEHLRTNF